MGLLLRSLEEAAGQVRDTSDGHILIRLREYSQVTAQDHLALLRHDSSGNGWLAALRGHGYTRQSEILLWVGFPSDGMVPHLGRQAGGSVFFSEVDPSHSHPWREIPGNSKFPLREVGWDGGHFWLMERTGNSFRAAQRTVDELTARILKEFVSCYLT
jgi:hypothetical protein